MSTMRSSALRVQKHRFLKAMDSDESEKESAEEPVIKKTTRDGDVLDSLAVIPLDLDRSNLKTRDLASDTSEESTTSSVSDDEAQENSDVTPVHETQTLPKKLKNWALSNSACLNNRVITDLLTILRSEGHYDLPRTASTLLETQHVQKSRPMTSQRDTEGSFIYLGIAEALKRIIREDLYTAPTIKVLVNVDGVSMYRSSKQQFWPILIKVFHNDYNNQPAIVAIYAGDSKPKSVNDYMKNFVDEVIALCENGIIIGSTLYKFEPPIFVCDTPARAFLKCCKGHTGFYCCERCETRGVSVGKNHRIFPEIDAKLRTHESFRSRHQPMHHLEKEESPLLKIPGFDIVNDVILDNMHLLCAGVMKTIIEKMTGSRKNQARLSRENRLILKSTLANVEQDVPCDFQRKRFDIDDLAHWKSTQYRFLIFHIGAVIFRKVLSTNPYKHLLLLFLSCRILADPELATQYTSYVKNLLRKFFYMLPAFYGPEIQSINFHNLIHLADDVKHIGYPITSFSAFPFENTAGKIKKLIRTPRNPLAQAANRLAELDSHSENYVRRRTEVKNAVLLKGSSFELKSVDIHNATLKPSHPDNVVRLRDGTIFEIDAIVTEKDCTDVEKSQDISLRGYTRNIKSNIFEYPAVSSFVGMFELGNRDDEYQTVSGSEVQRKCIVLNTEARKYSISFLHN